MKALSIRQPWAWYILYAGKGIENRDWRTSVRGRVLIHAAKALTDHEWRLAQDPLFMHDGAAIHSPARQDLARGGIVGSVEIVDCVEHSDSQWFGGRYGFVLRDPQPLPFYPCRGSLGFFDVELPEAVRA